MLMSRVRFHRLSVVLAEGRSTSPSRHTRGCRRQTAALRHDGTAALPRPPKRTRNLQRMATAQRARQHCLRASHAGASCSPPDAAARWLHGTSRWAGTNNSQQTLANVAPVTTAHYIKRRASPRVARVHMPRAHARTPAGGSARAARALAPRPRRSSRSGTVTRGAKAVRRVRCGCSHCGYRDAQRGLGGGVRTGAARRGRVPPGQMARWPPRLTPVSAP